MAEAELVDEDTAAQELPVAEEVQQQEPGLIDRVMANPLYAGSGLILLIGILLWLMRRNKKADAELESEIEEDFDADAAPVPAFVEEEPVLAAESEPTEDSSELGFDVDDFSAAIDEVDEPVVAGDNQQAVTSKPETGDAISEADIYIAYGRYQQAIDLLSAAIDNNPARTDLHVKLMEVYLETRDKPGFQQQYLKLQALQDDTAIVQVKEMLSTVDGVSGWLDGVGSGVAAISDEEMDQELIEGEEQGLQLDDAELDLDLDLDADIDDLAELTLEVEAADVVDTGFDDIELDLDESLLDDLSGSDTDTIQYDAADLEEALLASGVNDLELEEDTAKDLSSSATEEPAIDELVLAEDDAAAEPVEEDSFDLDIDLDSDFDLDLNDLSVDNADLEAEFGASQDAAKNDVVGDGDMDFEIAPELETASAAFDESPVSSELEQDGLEVDAPLSDQDTDFDIDTLATFDAEEAAAEFTGEGATDETAVSEEEDFDFLADTDEVATKLDLARAYIDMGDTEGAKDILDEVAQEGSEEQKQEASALLERID